LTVLELTHSNVTNIQALSGLSNLRSSNSKFKK